METIDKTMTDYDIFNIVKNHLISQGDKCVDPTGGDCQYYGLTDSKSNEIINHIYDEYHEDVDYLRELIEDERIKQNIPVAHCAVGALIKPEFYDDSLEGTLIDSNSLVQLAVQKSYPEWEITHQSLTMLQSLQAVHDNIQPRHWNEVLDKMSKFFHEDKSWVGDFHRLGDGLINQIIDKYKEKY